MTMQRYEHFLPIGIPNIWYIELNRYITKKSLTEITFDKGYFLHHENNKNLELCKLVNMLHNAALDISSLILMNDVILCKLVQHLLNLRQKFCCSCFVSRSAELTYCVTHSLSVISVVQSARRRLTNSFYR